MPKSASYANSVFINCPFDDAYSEMFSALTFTVIDCGYTARCALEVLDSAQVRIEKIMTIIEGCQFGIHDISRTELDGTTGLPRFNMPLELGLFLGARRYGSAVQRRKACLVLDSEPYRYQKYCSDIAGQDIESHGGRPENAIKAVRNWLQSHGTKRGVTLPSGREIAARYDAFKTELRGTCVRLKLDHQELMFPDYVWAVEDWQRAFGRE